MATFLSLHGIASGGARLVDLRPSEITDAISSGSVDAVIAWEPYAKKIRDSLGANALIWPGQSGQRYQFVLMAKEEFIKERPLAVERLLKALLEAEKYCTERTADAQNLVASRRGYDPASLQSLWKRVDFRVRLDQDLVTLMEDEAKWLLKQKGDRPDIPNYIRYIDWRPLEKIRPDTIGLIH